MGAADPTWYTSPSGLFLDAPHLFLMEHHRDDQRRAPTTRYLILTADGEITRQAQSMQAYTDSEYEALQRTTGFDRIELQESLT